MSGTKKTEEEKLHPIIASMTDNMNAQLTTIGLDNKTSRNEIIRIACYYLINNKKKLKLK
jgi:hypothetical protein